MKTMPPERLAVAAAAAWMVGWQATPLKEMAQRGCLARGPCDRSGACCTPFSCAGMCGDESATLCCYFGCSSM